jgi:hypothetical protein
VLSYNKASSGGGIEISGIARPQDGDLNGSALCDKGAVERTFVPIHPWVAVTNACFCLR